MVKPQEFLIQALKDAVQMEIDGQKFYQDAAGRAESPGARQIFDYLAESEKYHIVKIREIYQKLEKDPAWTEAMAAFEPPGFEPHACVSALSLEIQGQATKEDLDALKTGLKMEECSIALYEKLARQTVNPLGRRFFLSLVSEERGHYLNLLDIHNYLSDPADWFYVTQMGNVDGQ